MDSSDDEVLNKAASQMENSVVQHTTIHSQPTQVLDFDPANRPDPTSLEVLLRKFGHHQFRPFQWQIISSMLNRRQDNCAIMATGHGKSLLYQFPAVFSDGTTLVISPLISLMEDQVLSLTVANIPACLLGSAQPNPTRTIKGILNNEYRIVYLTPEFCCGRQGRELLCDIRKRCRLALIAIDEAHCVSHWGHDFRPTFRKLGFLKHTFVDVPVLAVTATATKKVLEDIVEVLKLEDPQLICSGFDRPNLYFEVRRKGCCVFDDLNTLMVWKNGRWAFEGPTIIYCIRRVDTVDISKMLNRCGVRSLPYHAGLTLSVRKHAHEQFVRDKMPVIVATIAFGMGIDKPDVRNVIHYGTSGSLEAYYQEVGRAGRDGLPSKCVTFFDSKDFEFHEYLFRKSGEDKNRRRQLLGLMKDYLFSRTCRRELILKYFDNKPPNLAFREDCCDICRRLGTFRNPAVPVVRSDTASVYKLSRLLINERSRMASSNACMPYMVATDTMLTQMARYRPRTVMELRELRIEGLTEARINKFMPQLLSVIINNPFYGLDPFYGEIQQRVLLVETNIDVIEMENNNLEEFCDNTEADVLLAEENIDVIEIEDEDISDVRVEDKKVGNIEIKDDNNNTSTKYDIKQEDIKMESAKHDIIEIEDDNNNDAILMKFEPKEIEKASPLSQDGMDDMLMNAVFKEDKSTEIEDDGNDDILMALCDKIYAELDENRICNDDDEPQIKKIKKTES